MGVGVATAMITSKGQITIPKSVRTKLKLEAGHRVEFIETDAGFLVKPATRDIRMLKGILPKPRRAVSIEDMNRSISRMGPTRGSVSIPTLSCAIWPKTMCAKPQSRLG